MPSKLNLRFALTTLAGGTFALGFAPFGYWPLTIIALAILFASWQGASKWQSASLGLCFGIGQFAVGVSWVYVSMVNFGNMSPSLAVIAVILMVLFLSCYPLLAGLAFAFVKSNSKVFNMVLLAPACWVVLELLRGYLFTGFPWLLTGYASIDTWLVGYAPLGGVVLSSLLMAVVAGLLVWSVKAVKLGLIRSAAISLLSGFLIFGLGAWLTPIKWAHQTGKELAVGLVQLSIPLQVKWQAGKQEEIFAEYLHASRTIEKEVDLLVWPEGALPQVYDQAPAAFLDQIYALNPDVIFGALERRVNEAGTQIHNSMVLLNPRTQEQFYRKHHLVPFGEFFPLKWLLSGLLAQLQIPMSDMTSWRGAQAHLQTTDFKLLPTICYEDAFPEDWRTGISTADAIINVSEDAWFGDSFAPHQRLEMGRFRSIEARREMLRVSNSGLSTVIRTDGSYQQISAQFEKVAMVDKLVAYKGDTPYVRWGRMPIYILLLAIVLIRYFVFGAKYNRRNELF